MDENRDLTGRVRTISVFASAIALIALAITVLADNHNAVFGRTVTRAEQIFLLALAALLCTAKTVAYFIERSRRERGSR
jgi:divalent metal cation (Fe/Co/Zn/Cd) transporter